MFDCNFEEKECSVIKSEWIPGDYQCKQGIKGRWSFTGWKGGSKYVLNNGTEQIFTPTQHRLICKDKDGNIYTTNVTQAAHHNGVPRWTKKKAKEFLINVLLDGTIKLLCSQYSNKAYITDKSFNENSKRNKSSSFDISGLSSKNKELGSDYTEFK